MKMLKKSLLLILFMPVLAYSMEDDSANNTAYSSNGHAPQTQETIGQFDTPLPSHLNPPTPNRCFKIELPNKEMIVGINLGTESMRAVGAFALLTFVTCKVIKLILHIHKYTRKQISQNTEDH